MSAAAGILTARPHLAKRILHELPLLVVLYLVYQGGRIFAGEHAQSAFSNAEQVWRVERWLSLPSEAALQQWAWQWPDLIRFVNSYYASAHFPVTCAALVWIFVWRPAAYPWFRWTLAGMTAVGMVGHIVYPLAPPRMLGHHGLLDTGVLFGQSVYSRPGTGIANQFAAMPSLHVGWAALIAVAVVATARSRWRWLVVLHPVFTVLVVVVTANHYWADAIVALAILAGTLLATDRLRPRVGRATAPSESTTAPSEPTVAPVPIPTPRPALVAVPSAPRPTLAVVPSEPRPTLVAVPSEPRPALAVVPSARRPALAVVPSESRPTLVAVPSEPRPALAAVPSEPQPAVTRLPAVPRQAGAAESGRESLDSATFCGQPG